MEFNLINIEKLRVKRDCNQIQGINSEILVENSHNIFLPAPSS